MTMPSPDIMKTTGSFRVVRLAAFCIGFCIKILFFPGNPFPPAKCSRRTCSQKRGKTKAPANGMMPMAKAMALIFARKRPFSIPGNFCTKAAAYHALYLFFNCNLALYSAIYHTFMIREYLPIRPDINIDLPRLFHGVLTDSGQSSGAHL